MDQRGGQVKSDEGSDEDQEEPSSSVERVEDALASFREQWQRELHISPKREAPDNHPKKIHSIESNEELSVENKAKNLFLKGVEHEQSGQLYDAIRFYKRAVQLVPDIEFRLYESTKPKSKDKLENIETVETLDNDDQDDMQDLDDNEDMADVDLMLKISRIVNRNQCVCSPHLEQSTIHISALPLEIILYILRWVVSSDLDIRSLEMFSRVCRGFFISARDPEIWRLACVRVWGVNCGHYLPKYPSWRIMYLERSRLRYNGCYISKNTYIRNGEKSFQDQFYRPWHLVEYFRYLRFFPEGRVLMLTSSDDAQSNVNSLKHRNPKNLSALIGHYRLHDSRVTLIMKKQEKKSNNINVYKKKRREVVHDSGEQTFHLEFEIQNHYKRVNSLLNWIHYRIFTQYKNGQQSTVSLNVYARYPPFKFNRVKSYTYESESPLQ